MTKDQAVYSAKILLNFFSVRKTPFLLLFSFISFSTEAQVTQTFTYTGAAQYFTVPSCVNTLTVSLAGAKGGGGINSTVGSGGAGGSVTAVINVNPGQILNLFVGGVGGNASNVTGGSAGYNGGGTGAFYNSTYSGGGGGGASDIRISPYGLADRIIVAGGGGGGSYYSSTSPGYERGGRGGASTGESGYFINSNTGGQGGSGGTASAGGIGGVNVTFCTANSGSLGLGGSAYVCGNGGGGGGGGYYGGGGGIFAGGGGGSNYAIPGSLNIVSSQGLSSGNGTIVLTYNQVLFAPIVSSAGTNTICGGTTIDLSISTSFAATSYSWSNGANTSTITVTPTSATIYTLVATDGTCNIISSSTITTVPAIPSLTVVNSSSGNSYGVCPNKTATLTANGAVTYTWTGLNTVTNGVPFTPTVSSSYTIIGENACGTSSAVTSVSIHPNPVLGITALTGSICSGNTTTISVTGNSSSHTITTVVSAPQVTSNVGFQPAVTNTYNITGSSVMGCTVSANTSVQVIQTPTLAPTSTTLILCIGQSATLSASGATGGYTWTSGTSTLGTGNTLLITPNSTTTYSVTKNNTVCFDTKTISIQVNSLSPTFATAVSTLICASKSTTLSAFGGIGYTWYSSATPTTPFSNATSPAVSPSVTTTYTVAASDGTCINTAAVTVSTNPNPTINIVTTSTNICIGSAVSLTATGGQGTNYTWTSIPATTTITGQDVIFPSFPTVGAYAFSATGDNAYSCTTTIVKIVIVNLPPTLNAFASKTLVCSGGPTTLNVTGANNYQWDANANSATTATTLVNPISNMIYIVSGTVTSTQCSASTSVAVSIYTPSLSITSPTNTCYGAAFTLTCSVNNPANGSINSYTWSVPGSSNSNGTSVLVTPTVLTVYTLSAKSNTMGTTTCVETKTTSVGIFNNPTITATPSRTYICRNDQFNLVGHGADSYTWNGGAYTGSLISVSHNTIGTVVYTIAGTDANGCKNDTVLYLKINGCQGVEELEDNYGSINVYPNPNNGWFNIVSDVDLKLKLMNELGQVIREFEMNPYNEHKVQVVDLAKGIYFIIGTNNQAVTRQKIIVE